MACNSHCQRNWKLASGAVLIWEGSAAASKALHAHGVTPVSLPFITELVRALPRPLRIIATLAIAAVVHDHFDTRKVFG